MNPSVEERLGGLDHVLYEMEMFVHLPMRCDVIMLQNAINESYLIHARVLCDFFQQNRRNDDIVCEDYGFERKALGVPDDIEKRFDKSLAHLTYSRLKFTGNLAEWITDRFRPQLLARIREFLLYIIANPALGRPKEIERAHSLLACLNS